MIIVQTLQNPFLQQTIEVILLYAATFQEVLTWFGNYFDPEEWDGTHDLEPTATTMPIAPRSLLECLSSKYRKGCDRACGCRKAGLRFTGHLWELYRRNVLQQAGNSH